MKKWIISSLLALCATFSLAAIGCKEDNDNKDEKPNGGIENPLPQGETYTVTIEGGEGYTIVGEGVSYDATNDCWKATVVENKNFTFSLDLGAFYAGIPTVTMNNVAVAEANGAYTITVTEDATVSIGGIFKDASAMMGTGTEEDAYVITRPIDFVYIAEQVNAGKGNYAGASYVLAADIDFKGEEIIPIGTGTNPFTGCFTCQTNADESGTMGYTISNFKINTNDTNYVGLFGCVQVDMSVFSSGLFYGINIADFEINASAIGLAKASRNLYCGGLIGYGVGSRAYLCTAKNGEINVSGDAEEFSFAGGLIGVQQSAYIVEYNQMYNAETAYASVDVDVSIVNGTGLFAGGIAGYLITNSFTTPSYIHNSYATGNVGGAIRTGGIVGGLGQYTSVTTCYSTGNVSANCDLTANTDKFQKEHCIAYAGGIAGYAENDSVVNECFAVGKIIAKAVDGSAAEVTHHAVAGGDADKAVSVSSRKYIVRDCRDSIDKSTMISTLEGMGFHPYNWVLTNTDYPVINYEPSEENLTIRVGLKFVDKAGNDVLVNGVVQEQYSYENTYVPIARAFVDGSIGWTMRADDNKLLSFGYFFDEACTQPVPASFISTKNTTLYVGFTNPEPILGTYTLAIKDAETPLTVTLHADGTATCANGNETTSATYQYNGETLVIEGAYLARYFLGEVDIYQSVNEDPLFDLNRYMSYYFQANVTEKGLELFDGTYFTETAPLKAYYPTDFDKLGLYYVFNEDGEVDEYLFYADGTVAKNGKIVAYSYDDGVITIDGKTSLNKEDLNAYDALKGRWQKSAFVAKVFHFDGIDRWETYTTEYTRDMTTGNTSPENVSIAKGTYATADGNAYILKTADGATYATVTLDEFGFLSVVYATGGAESYAKENSFLGEWRANGVRLQLDGINGAGEGNATLTFTDIDTTYKLTYAYSETATHLCLYLEGTPFGYFTHNVLWNMLVVTVYDPTSLSGEYATYALQLVNEFNDVWITNNPLFENVVFDSLGEYDLNGNWVGKVELNQGTENAFTTTYTLTNGGTKGYFEYNSVRYSFSYDDMQRIIYIDSDIILERRDVLADTDFIYIDENGKISTFVFDGASGLTSGGKMTMKLVGQESVTFTYTADASAPDTYAIADGNNGSIVKDTEKACYVITVNGTSYDVYIRNEFIGEWALSGEFSEEVFVIGATDLDGYIHAKFMGEGTKLEKLDTDFYSFYCEPNGMPTTYYLFVLYDNDTGKFDSFALSEYSNLLYGDYILCSRIDGMKGVWSQYGNGNIQLAFDGVQSLYSNGTATMSYLGYPTAYFYRVYTDAHGEIESVMLWSQNTYPDNTMQMRVLYYKLIPTTYPTGNTNGKIVFVLGDRAFEMSEIDSLYKLEAKDKDGWTYSFDGGNIDSETWGTITATKKGETDRTLAYNITSFNNDKTATITVKETVDGVEKTYTATLDYKDNTNLTLTFEEQTENA